METRLTEEQAEAVSAPLAENLVSAAAGSGKTKVLSERIVKRVKSGDTSIDRLLIVTFTRAAAAQMKERIAAALLSEYKVTRAKSLKRQMSLVPGADIMTIDSFCIDVVRKNFFRADVPPDFAIADGNAMRILKDEVLEDVLETLYGEGNEAFLSLAESVGNRKNDEALKKMIFSLCDFISSLAEPDKWLEDAVSAHDAQSGKNAALKAVLADEITGCLEDVGEDIDTLARFAEDAGLDSYVPVLKTESVRFKSFLSDFKKSRGGEIFSSFEFGGFQGKKAPAELSEAKKSVLSEHDAIKKAFKKASQLYEAANAPWGVCFEKVRALCGAVKLFRKEYLNEKLARKELEFSDCEYFALKILSESEEAAEELRKKYDEIYIDEYQDTNPLQDALFSLVSRKSSGEPNLFIVGDVKQSIYGFRHSDPTLFSHKAETFKETGAARKMVLTKNFRSRREVIDSVNCVFRKIMRKDTAGIEYSGEHTLVCGAKYIEYNKNKSELYILANDSAEDDELKREEMEAVLAASKIKEMLASGFMVSDEGVMRKARFSDFAVLSRAINGKAGMITRVFELMDVPCECGADRDFFSSMEISGLCAFLSCIDNPLSDIPTASLMNSCAFSFTENELLEIRLENRSENLYKNVVERAKKGDALGEKCKAFLDKLDFWRGRARVMRVEDFLSLIYDETGFYSFVGALPGGAARQENLRELLKIAEGFEKTQYKGLYSFVRYLERTIEAGGGADNESERGDRVLITTIHKSKGLEFPVVIIIGCGAKFNESDSASELILNPKGGMALVETDLKRHIRYKPPEYRAVSLFTRRDAHAEQMRLLYVAMTRAMEKLIVIASVKDPEAALEAGEKMSSGHVTSHKIREMTTYLSYILTILPPNSPQTPPWDIHLLHELPPIVRRAEPLEEVFEECGNEDEILRRLTYIYPYQREKNMPSKMSVSEVKRLVADSEPSVPLFETEVRRTPSFLKKKEKLSGASRGTAYHRVLELIDLNEKDVNDAIARMRRSGLISDEEAECVKTADIEAFLASPLAEMMRNAKKIYRETSFTMPASAKAIFNSGGNEIVMVQGTIDLFFETKKRQIILVDFKTDVYNSPEEVAKKYKKQLELYELAIFMRFSQKCEKKYLYLFHKNDIISI